ncbi:MAG: DUF4330 domain-containing protein [Ruminococcaceae bacterium]|nr:DUF4330 domain-containing protein [Oscillospiraceae bacterium]
MKKRLNFIDIIIISFVILAICFAVVYFASNLGKTYKTSQNKVLHYVVELKSTPEDIGNYIKNGDIVRDSITGTVLGKIINVDIKDNVEIRENTIDGTFIETSFPDKKDVYVTIETTPTLDSNQNIRLDTIDIKIGKMLYIRTKQYAGSGYITNLNLFDKEK